MSALRPPGEVMRLARLGVAHQTRLSFMRVLLRRLRREGWSVARTLWQLDARGVGRAVYEARGPGGPVSLVAFAHDLPDHLRSDRVIAEAWDATFALYDGVPTRGDLDRLAANVPLQEAGRVSDRELVLSRANRSVRLWDHVVARLAAGQQPDPALVEAVGYLMRTTAVYGSGKFGAADFAALRGRGVLDGPFRAEMLTVWLIRAFVADLVEHHARARGGAGAARLAPGLRRRLGIGNSTGLGMAPFLVNHPLLLNAWVLARETALARVRALPGSRADTRARFREVLARATAGLDGWHSAHPLQSERLAALGRDAARLGEHLASGDEALDGPRPWDRLWRWGEGALGVEGQEWLASLLIEPHGALVDDLAEAMAADEAAAFAIDGGRSVAELRELAERRFAWVPRRWDTAATARFWYVSEAKLEPRLGERHEEPGAELELPLDIARQAAALLEALDGASGSVADFLARHPEHRGIVRRLQATRAAPYAEIRDNLTASDMLPIDMLRCKLAFFGATRFDPRSDRWVRITMFQDAPGPDDLAALPEDDWAHPPPAGNTASAA